MGDLSVRLMSRSISRISSDATWRRGGGRGLSEDAEDAACCCAPGEDTFAAYASAGLRTACSAWACVVLVRGMGAATQPFCMSNTGESLRLESLFCESVSRFSLHSWLEPPDADGGLGVSFCVSVAQTTPSLAEGQLIAWLVGSWKGGGGLQAYHQSADAFETGKKSTLHPHATLARCVLFHSKPEGRWSSLTRKLACADLGVSAERSRWSDDARFNTPETELALALGLAAAGAAGEAVAAAAATAVVVVGAVRCRGERTPERTVCTLVGPLALGMPFTVGAAGAGDDSDVRVTPARWALCVKRSARRIISCEERIGRRTCIHPPPQCICNAPSACCS
jgi:hypothetical protein